MPFACVYHTCSKCVTLVTSLIIRAEKSFTSHLIMSAINVVIGLPGTKITQKVKCYTRIGKMLMFKTHNVTLVTFVCYVNKSRLDTKYVCFVLVC